MINTKETIGFIKINESFSKNANIDFIDFISNSKDNNEMCNFDIIIFMNLVANRSYLDLNQYPVFPVLFLYDKQKKNIERNFKLHIGFQKQKEKGKKRCEIIKRNYNDNNEDINEDEKDNEVEDLYYFNTHYSNIVYTSMYLMA